MDPIVTTLIESDLDNDSAVLNGNTQNNGWTILEWGFWWYKKSAGIETKAYIAASGTPAEGDFAKFKTGLLPYTEYLFQARCYYKIWDVELEDWVYIEIFGDWLEFTTHAYSTTLQILACNILKSIGGVTFWGSINTPDDGYVIERGFEYGLTKTPTWKVSEEGSFSVGMFSLNASGLSLNTDFYVRAYLKTASGHYFYTSDGDDRGWAKFTTKILTNNIAVLSNAGYYITNEDFLRVFNNNGQENNAWKLPEGEYTSEITVDKEGNAYYGWYDGGTNYRISKRRLIDGVLIDTWTVSKYPRGISIGYGDYIFTLETDTQAKNAVLYKRNISDLTEIAHIDLVATDAFYCGIIADMENHVYIGRTTDPDRIEKYALYDYYDVIDVVASGEKVGNDAINRDGTDTGYYTEILEQNPATVSGKITSVEIWAHSTMTGVIVATFTKVNGNTFTARDSQAIGTVIAGAKRTFEVDLDMEEGDYLGIYWEDGELEADLSSGLGAWLLEGDYTSCIETVFDYWEITYSLCGLWAPVEYSFTIAGDHTSEFLEGISIVVAGSTGNNGTYTIAKGGSYLDGEDTIIPVNETVSSPIADGNITRSGNLTRLAYINSPTSLQFGSLGISGNYVYAGAYFDLPSKANKALTEIEAWSPAGEWYSTDFFHVGSYKNKVIVEGTPYSGYSRALACYDENGTQLWKTDLVRGINAVSGYPYPGEATLINTKAINIAGHCYLYGEITEISGTTIVERGFEYLVQEEMPSAEDTGEEVKETSESGFDIGEYHLSSWGTFNDLYRAPFGTMWFFRAYCKDDEDNKFVADSWMPCMPTATTQAADNINYNKADGHGYAIDKGASDLTVRGFEVKFEFYGELPESWKYEIAGFVNPEMGAYVSIVPVKDENGFIIDFKWEATLIKTVSETYEIDLGAFMITIGEMEFGWPVMDNCLFEGDTYQYRAFATNPFGTAYGCDFEVYTPDGELVATRTPYVGNSVLTVEEQEAGYYTLPKYTREFTTPVRYYLSDETPTVGPYTIIKNEVIQNLPDGIYATRRGFKYGNTISANDHDIHEDGQFTNGPFSAMLPDFEPDTTYYVVSYIVVQGIVYKGEMEIITTEPEPVDEDGAEFPTPYFGPKGQDYREVVTRVEAEAIASQGIIDYVGEKKSLSVNNHLIQSNSNAVTIVNNYLASFQLPKMKMMASYPNPLPIERRDEIQYSSSILKFKENGMGVVKFKDDRKGVYKYFKRLVMTVRKMDSNLTLTKDSINFEASLELEE